MTKAPWTEEQVQKLIEHQDSSMFHPYTCNRAFSECEVNEGDYEKDGSLIPTIEGWICPCGKYKQNWF